jgi:hypothetical protein
VRREVCTHPRSLVTVTQSTKVDLRRPLLHFGGYVLGQYEVRGELYIDMRVCRMHLRAASSKACDMRSHRTLPGHFGDRTSQAKPYAQEGLLVLSTWLPSSQTSLWAHYLHVVYGAHSELPPCLFARVPCEISVKPNLTLLLFVLSFAEIAEI